MECYNSFPSTLKPPNKPCSTKFFFFCHCSIFSWLDSGDMTGSKWKGEGGTGSPKVHEAGFELGTSEAQLHHMSVRCPRSHRHQKSFIFWKKSTFFERRVYCTMKIYCSFQNKILISSPQTCLILYFQTFLMSERWIHLKRSTQITIPGGPKWRKINYK